MERRQPSPESGTVYAILRLDAANRSSMTTTRRFHALGAVAAGAIFLTWPAFVNGYPLLFSDTGSFMEQLLLPFMIWDKPWIYGPVLVAASLKLTLWLPVLAQSLAMSWVIWRVEGAFRTQSPGWHLGICLLLAMGSAAPWFTSLLMPDFLAPVTVLTLFLLAFGTGDRQRWPVMALASFAIAAHLTHLVIATACLAVVLTLRPGGFVRAAVPLGVAVMLLLTTNLIGFGRFGVSPYGAVFGLARLATDGPAEIYLEDSCPASDYRMCDWIGRMPTDADEFLWSSSGPVWPFPGGPIALAPEASRIVIATIVSQPMAVARAALGNWLSQIVTLRPDSVIGGSGLDESVGVQLHAHYPAAEDDRYRTSAQRADGLRAVAAPWQNVYLAVLALGFAGSSLLLLWSWRNDGVLFTLIVMIAAGLLSNAFATGVLSGPHDRYQARIAWLVLLPPMMFAMRRQRLGKLDETARS
jgi:hypothetical protein